MPQPGIFALGTSSHAYLEFDLSPAPIQRTRRGPRRVREPRTTIGGFNLVAGFRPELWAEAVNRCLMASPASTTPMVGAGGYTLPATQHDMVMWLSGPSYDVVFDLSRAIVVALARLREAGARDGWLAVPPRP